MNRKARLALALLIPFIACGVQWLLWDYLRPYVWFLFFPTAFFSAWLGGLAGGLSAAVIGALLVWYVFIPPRFSFTLTSPAAGFSIAVFVVMGTLFALFFERLKRAMQRTDEALAETRAANDQITALYRKTLELDEIKSQFFANVSHELRTPLTLILAPLEQRLRALPADSAGEERRQTEMMLRNARLLYRHVSDLLDAARLESGRMELHWARLDLARLVRVMASHFETVATERRIAYGMEAPEDLMIEADGEKLQRVLINLLSNAFKFTPDGGAIAVRLAREAGEARIEVQDNGPGVPAELRQAVFERFRQGEGGASRRHGGTGLGLAIVKDFVELHGGAVELEEAPDGGALFRARLPLAAPRGTVLGDQTGLDPVIEAEAVQELRPPAPPVGGLSGQGDAPLVLVVEDNPDMSAFIAAALRPHFRVVCAADGREGRDRALALRPDLILSDIMMPVMSGDEMVEALRAWPDMADIPIAMLTAKADEALRVRLFDAGIQAYIPKPFTVEELLARVGALVREKRRTGERLRESESRFQAVFEQAAVGVALVAPDGTWLQLNRRLSEILGYDRAELMGKTFQEITYPEDLSSDLEFVRRLLAGELASYAMEKRYVRKDGRAVWCTLTAALVRKPDGAPDFFISVVEDIQARKDAEDARRRQSEELLQRNRELERFDRASVAREMAMVALKREANTLCRELGRPEPHDLSFTDAGRDVPS